MVALYVFAAFVMGFVILFGVISAVSVVGVVAGVENFAVVGAALVYFVCALGVIATDALRLKEGSIVGVRSLFVLLPALSGVLLSLVSMGFFWFGLWIALSFAFLNVWRRAYEREAEARERKNSLLR
jgi:hypothetical protein